MTADAAAGPEDGAMSILIQISSLLEQQQQPQQLSGEAINSSLNDCINNLHSISSPSITTQILARLLFVSPSAEGSANGYDTLDSRRALAVLAYLVQSDAKTYLKPSSRSVRSSADNLGTPDPATGSIPAANAELSDETLAVIVSQLGGDDVESADNAGQTLVLVSKHLGPSVAVRCIQAVAQAWQGVVRTAEANPEKKRGLSTVSIRCASTIVDLANLSDGPMEAAISSGATDLLLNTTTDSSDPLMQVSALDLLERMATTIPMHGNRARWLYDRKVLAPLLEMAGGGLGESAGAGQPDPILGGPALRTLSSFCKLAHMPQEASLFGLADDSKLLSGFHRALHCFKEAASGENGDRLAFVDAVSSWASASPKAMSIVLEDSILRDGWLSLNVSQPKLKSVILYSVATSIDPPTQIDSSGDTVMASNIPTNALSMALFEALGTVNGKDATDLVLSIATSPLAEERLGAYALLNAVAKRGTGAQVLLSHNSFYEFLVTREKESTKEGKEAKHDIIEAVLASDARPLLADSVVETLEKIAKQGPHYVNAQPYELATEEG